MIKIGVLIIGEKPPAGSPYDRWIVYRSATQSGSYTKQNGATGQAITDLSYYDETGASTNWYKVTYYYSSDATESAFSDAIQGQSVNYTSVRKVESLLQLPTTSDTTNPSTQEIVEVINRVEDIIDRKTGHAWRPRFSGTTSGRASAAEYVYYDVNNFYEYHTGRPVYLSHRKIKTLSAAAGDALEFWNGASWEDWLATKTEGRADDFWVDYEQGILFIRGYWNMVKPKSLRLKFRYGDNYVDGGIEDIATKMVAIDILTGMDPRALLIQENGTMAHDARVSRWRDEVTERMDGYKEWQVPVTMQM